MKNLTLKQSERLADGIFGSLFILCALVTLAALVFYGETASTGTVLFGLFVFCGSLAYPIASLCKD